MVSTRLPLRQLSPFPLARPFVGGLSWKRVVVMSVLELALASCGGSELERVPGTKRANSSERASKEAAQATNDTTPPAPATTHQVVELNGPPRALKGRKQVTPEWADPLRLRIDPESDDSQSEKIAVRFERSCAQFIEALIRGDERAAKEKLAPGFEGARGLFPEFRAARFDDGSFEVSDWVAQDSASATLEALMARAADSRWAQSTDLQVSASVVAIEAGALEGIANETGSGARWNCRVELRIVANCAGVRTSSDIELDVQLEEAAEPSTPARLIAMRATEQRLVRRKSSVFQDISGHVLAPLPYWKREMALGVEHYMDFADRRQIPFGTGMLGMALGDVNGDGLEDVYISTIGGFPNRLLLNQADGSVIDGAFEAGVAVLDTTRGCLLVDLDGDDDLDLCVSRESSIIVFWNDGHGKFTSNKVLLGPDSAPIYSLCAADPDGDGDLDLFASRYLTGRGVDSVPTPYHDAKNGAVNLYWRNEGKSEFTLAGEETGLSSGAPRYTFVALWEDFDDDGQIDLYVVNDFGPNNLYKNDGGKFVDVAAEHGLSDAAAGMGISAADIELDGDLDLFVTNMYSAPGQRATVEATYRPGESEVRAMHQRMTEGNSLMLQSSPGSYIERAASSGVDHGGWAWGGVFYDWNLDGLPDIYLPNGFVSGTRKTDLEAFFWRWVVRMTPPPIEDVENYLRHWTAMSSFNQLEGYSYNGYERNHVYLNIGGGEFADVSPLSDVDFIDDGRVAARLDWDGDGREDLLLVNRTAPRVRLVRNVQASGGHRVVIELHGLKGSADAVGARIRVHRSDEKVVTRTVYAGEGLLGQSSYRQFFGLGTAEGKVDVEVRWPDGTEQKFEQLDIDRGWKLFRAESRAEEWAFRASPFEGRAPAAAPAASEHVSRLVLAAKLPLRNMTLQRAGRSVALSELDAGNKLLVFWDPRTRSGEAHLRQLAALQPKLAKRQTTLYPVAMSEATEASAKVLAQLGLEANALVASQSDELVLTAILLDILGAHDDVALPLVFLLDSASQLCALYFVEPAPTEVLDDLIRMQRLNPDDDSTAALSRGYWLGQPRGKYNQLVRALQMIGARDLASDIQQYSPK